MSSAHYQSLPLQLNFFIVSKNSVPHGKKRKLNCDTLGIGAMYGASTAQVAEATIIFSTSLSPPCLSVVVILTHAHTDEPILYDLHDELPFHSQSEGWNENPAVVLTAGK